MGANLSSTFEPDLSKVVLAPQDRFSDLLVPIIWAAAFYAMAMIWSTLALVDRWKGPTDKIRVGGSSVMVAIAASTAWPVVLVYLMASG